MIGTIDIYANKTLGNSFNDIAFDPETYKVAEAMKKSKEIAKNEYPDGEIKSTKMVVYSYPSIGAMTIIKDKVTGVKHRIFVDAYTLEEVEDKPATETEPGVWSMYEMKWENGVEENLKEWEKSDQLTKSIEQAAANKGVNINAAVTEENIEKLSADAVTPKASGITLPVTKRGQENDVYCGCACCQTIGEYICDIYRTQDYIYDFQEWHDHNNLSGGLSISDAVGYCYYTQQQGGLGQRGTDDDYTLSSMDAVGEINNNRPFMSLIKGHFRLCYGYLSSGSLVYMYIIDPKPVGSGSYTIERCGANNEVARIYVRPS
ncbi:GTPases - Sulfate adenylate transferase subunit 1 [Methanosarcina siciliae T4/M]|uniref:GTPases-Sulfate adenylate transferase subunit 1 n=1 Tax=Methanosarcina siciliae T4/M TaxID=1434120 RepID=A0A0E3P754_9EURY|nr:GTPase - sulfate adenylate transferase subunit 1 [Methanosarcina siciliae]AKB29675.1 GTPases - Sulfate adenylate transferase subunit 1 [Methanosarcina siciliae T4/M]